MPGGWNRSAIMEVGRHFDSPDKLDFDRDWKPRQVAIELIDPTLTTAQRDILTRLAEWRLPIPYIGEQSAGRTLYVATRSNTATFFATTFITTDGRKIRGFKFKGAGGLTPSDSGFIACRQPQPQQPYGTRQFHIKVEPDLTLKTVESSRKAAQSLTLAAARNEYAMQARLAQCNLGFRPTLAARFLQEDAQDEKDFLDRQTGVVISEHDPDYVRVSDVTDFTATTDGGLYGSKDLEELFGSPLFEIEKLQTNGNVVLALRRHFLRLIEQIGICKRRSALEAGIARQAADTGNFFVHKNKGTVLVSDTDTCISYDNIEGDARGAQLLRDTGNDLFKLMTRFTFTAYREDFVDNLGKFNPFARFLKGFFVDTTARDCIRQEERSLCEALKKLFEEHKDDFNHIAKLRETKHSAGERKFLMTQWMGLLDPLLANCLSSVYNILLASSLQDSFPIKKIDPALFARQVETFVIDDFLRTMQEYNETLVAEQLRSQTP